jgi:hypothetical protein
MENKNKKSENSSSENKTTECKEDHDYEITHFRNVMYQGDLSAIIHRECKKCKFKVIETPWN